MSVRKYDAAPECQQYAKQHVVVEGGPGRLTQRDRTGLQKHCAQRSLTLRGVHAESLAFLDDWKDLHSLKIYGGKILDCSALIRLKHFKNLWYVTNSSRTPDFSFLSSLTALEKLGIGYVTHPTTLPDLSRCKRLKRLTIFKCRSLENISTVTKIPKLESFEISGTPQQPEDLEPVMAMKSLREIHAVFGAKAPNTRFDELREKYGLSPKS